MSFSEWADNVRKLVDIRLIETDISSMEAHVLSSWIMERVTISVSAFVYIEQYNQNGIGIAPQFSVP